jgi:hypothetical protein
MSCARYCTTRSQRRAVEPVEALPVEGGRAFDAGNAAQQLHDALADGRLAASRLADQCRRSRRGDRERHAVDRPGMPVLRQR